LIQRNQSESAELATVNVVLVPQPNGTSHLQAEQPATCKSCGLCGADSSIPSVAAHLDTTPLSLSLPVRTLALIAIGLYGVPLAGLLAGTLLAAALGAGDFGALAGAVAGCVGAVVLMRPRASQFESLALEHLRYRPQCHLCELLLDELRPMLDAATQVEIVDISDDPALLRRYGLRIPVLSCNGEEISGYPLNGGRIRQLLGTPVN
jgi:positive regulator of sigma E activity